MRTIRWPCFVPALAYMGLIFWLSSRPPPEPVTRLPVYWGLFKLSHLLEYGLLAALWAYALGAGARLEPGRRDVWTVVATVLWGLTDEVHQAFVPSRSPAWEDLATDLIAALLWVGAWRIVGRRRHGEKKTKKSHCEG